MTPKERAEELFDVFYKSVGSFCDSDLKRKCVAKRCALDAIDLRLWAYVFIIPDVNMNEWAYKNKTYWISVKKEMEKI